MAKISINLLPPEITERELTQTRFYKIQFVGIAIILALTFLASLAIALRILQSHNIAQYQTRLTKAEERVSGLKDTQASLFLLKNRLTTINQYYGTPSQQSSMYDLIDRLIPLSVAVNAISIDKTGKVTLLALVPDPVSLDNLVNDLTTKENNEDRIGQLAVESLNRGRDGVYRVSFTIKPK